VVQAVLEIYTQVEREAHQLLPTQVAQAVAVVGISP
jgi:hypothetical protein